MSKYIVKLSSVSVPLPPEKEAAHRYACNWFAKTILELTESHEQPNRAGDADNRPDLNR